MHSVPREYYIMLGEHKPNVWQAFATYYQEKGQMDRMVTQLNKLENKNATYEGFVFVKKEDYDELALKYFELIKKTQERGG